MIRKQIYDLKTKYMDKWQILGYIAASLGAVSLVPEVIKALRTHHLQDIAWGMLFLLMGASASWLLYSFHTNDMPLLLSAGFNLVIESILIFLKIHYAKKKRPLFVKPMIKKQALEIETALNDEAGA